MTEKIEDLETRNAMYYHLVYNHYPPYPTAMVETCIEAVKAAKAGNLDQEIALPGGYQNLEGGSTIPARDLIENHHLNEFID